MGERDVGLLAAKLGDDFFRHAVDEKIIMEDDDSMMIFSVDGIRKKSWPSLAARRPTSCSPSPDATGHRQTDHLQIHGFGGCGLRASQISCSKTRRALARQSVAWRNGRRNSEADEARIHLCEACKTQSQGRRFGRIICSRHELSWRIAVGQHQSMRFFPTPNNPSTRA